MSRPRSRLTGWTYDDERQVIRSPAGYTITLREIAQRLQDDLACRYDFAGPWTGWKMRGNRLIPPQSGRSGPVLKPESAPLLIAWANEPARLDAMEHAPKKPRLYLVR